MPTTIRGKCWIYKRATLYPANEQPQIIEYSSGIEPFDCDTVQMTSDGIRYNWEVIPGQIIPIPLNISRHNTYSIIRQGQLKLDDGSSVSWEFIFGKFMTHNEFMMKKFVEYLPFLFVILVLMMLMMRK